MDKDCLTVPHRVYELEQARSERREKRFLGVICALIAVVILTNSAWLYCWMQYDYSSEQTVSLDCADGIATFVGGDGSINYGEDYCNK